MKDSQIENIPPQDQKENRPEGKRSSKEYIRMLLAQLKGCKEQIAQLTSRNEEQETQLEALTEQNTSLRAMLKQSLPYRGVSGDEDTGTRGKLRELEVEQLKSNYEAKLAELASGHAQVIDAYRAKITELLGMVKAEREKTNKATFVAKRAIEDAQKRTLYQFSSEGLKLTSSSSDC